MDCRSRSARTRRTITKCALSSLPASSSSSNDFEIGSRHIFALQRIELVLTHQTRARVMGSYISNFQQQILQGRGEDLFARASCCGRQVGQRPNWECRESKLMIPRDNTRCFSPGTVL